MKKLFTICLLSFSLLTVGNMPANAGFFAAQKAKIEKNKEINSEIEQISSLFDAQSQASNKHDADKLAAMYSPKYVNNDGFGKEIYFKLIRDTWEAYPDIAYASKLRSVDLKGNYAVVDVLEAAVATTPGLEDIISTAGELTSLTKTTYYLEKVGGKWYITSENVSEERTFLKFGEAKYLDIHLNAPSQVSAGQDYTASLKVDTPEEAIVIASIGKEKIQYPEVKNEDVFRKLPDDEILERVFNANKDNINEYAVASVGITRAHAIGTEEVSVYMSGLAFLMTRVNVIPVNNYIKVEETDEQKTK